ncbi:hypothetical protein TrispH2_011402 [Trichoplax sp. H2]|nr:hypothetical protein TrispH2_011402 [Trichoplax sp. H2]|eukprot:RDD37038.1 hypothetical protein TrispH2_011402 [Trichoplax sp. H2]
MATASWDANYLLTLPPRLLNGKLDSDPIALADTGLKEKKMIVCILVRFVIFTPQRQSVCQNKD